MKVLYWIFIGWWLWPIILMIKGVIKLVKISTSQPSPSSSRPAATPTSAPVSAPKTYVPRQSKVYSFKISAEGKNKHKEVAAATRFSSWELGKALWTSHYKAAFDIMTDVKALEDSGIYKITNTSNGMVYIGQAKNIKKRWREHIRIGVGADFPSANNQMYQDMYFNGPETFTFQVIDYCNEKILDEREKYWIGFYDSYNKGYNKTHGNG